MRSLYNKLPLIILLGGFLWSAYSVAVRTVAEVPADVKVIRIGHWQLESGVRDAFNELAADFARRPDVLAKHGKVRVVQDAIPESIYGQWVSTQMIAGTAPDLLEVGLGLPPPIWLAYQSRYFLPLTTTAGQPNPFNEGTSLAGRPLKDTFGDGMRSGYVEELQEYVRVPLARFTARVFYNADLLERLTGLREPPTDYRQFLAVCDKIAGQRDAAGEPYVPIASSKYHLGMWQGAVCEPLTYRTLFNADLNRDGYVGNDETFTAFRAGAVSFDTESVRARFDTLIELMRHFQTGFAGLTRDEAVFLFAQQRAVFMSTGTWDAGSLVDQAEGKFRVGAMNFPQPSPHDPVYGPLVFGPNFDPAGQGFPFGITRFSKHPEVARDFLLFLASKEGNTKLNKVIGWIPSVIDAPLPPLLAAFKPTDSGMYSALSLDLGGETVVKFQQLYAQMQTDPTYTYDRFAKAYRDFYVARGLLDWEEQRREWRRGVANNERFLAGLRAEALLHAGDDAGDPRWVRYRTLTAGRQLFPDIGNVEQRRMVRGEAPYEPPYRYRPAALARIRADVKNGRGDPTTLPTTTTTNATNATTVMTLPKGDAR